MIFDIGWRSVMLALVFLADLIVFADLARAELSGLHARHQAQRQAAGAAALGSGQVREATERPTP